MLWVPTSPHPKASSRNSTSLRAHPRPGLQGERGARASFPQGATTMQGEGLAQGPGGQTATTQPGGL